MRLQNHSNKPFWIFFTIFSFFFIYSVVNILSAKASIIDNIINLFTSSTSSQNISVKNSLSDDDLLKPTVNSSVYSDSSSSSNSNNSDSSDQIKITNDGSLVVQSGPMRVSTEKEKIINDSISLYEVKQGDTLDTIASLFGISKNTIVWANNLKNNKVKLNPGDSILIMPITGIKYTVKNSGTVLDIAKKYAADPTEIAEFNGLSINSELNKGDSIIIPDAEGDNIPYTSSNSTKLVKNNSNSTKQTITKYKNNIIVGYFMKPVNCVKTQGLHGPYHSAVDWGCAIGTPVAAAANGVVIRATLGGYNGGYGSVIIISHPNGTQTIYAHLSKVGVTVGQKVSQGEIIGATGNTGESTGPHLHFETRGTGNPFG